METYKYSAKDTTGKKINGYFEAESESGVTEFLHSNNLIILSVTKAKVKASRLKSGRITSDDLVIFARQLATMIDAGIPLVQSLGILGEQIENKGLKNVVITVRREIEGGMNFCDSLGKHPSVFSDFFINMARAGETSGMLAEVLDRLATFLEKSAALTRKIKASLVYPAVVLTVAILITTLLLVKVVPTFKGIFEMLGGELPLPTRILVNISDLLRTYLLFLVGGLVIGGFLLKRYIGTEKGRYNFDKWKLIAPILGPLFRKVALVKFARTFSTLVKSGVPVLNALDIVAKTAGNKVMEETVMQCSSSVREGEPISLPLSRSKVFPPMVCRMIGVGEQTGQLEKMLTKIADFYEEQVEAAVSALTSVIEPIIITFLGVVVGGIVIALFMPIFKISEMIAR